jgi:hypothetical protein
MTLKPGKHNTAWSLVDGDDEVVKQFFVTVVGVATITLDIAVTSGAPLTGDELQQVHDEVQRQNPGREVAWKHSVRFVPEVPVSGIRLTTTK